MTAVQEGALRWFKWVGVACVLVLLLGTEPARCRSFDFDLRWDGSALRGGRLLNPALFAGVDEQSATITVQGAGEEHRIWEFQLVDSIEDGLTGGILVGGRDNTWSYGVGGRVAPWAGVGMSLQRTGWTKDDYEYSAGFGVAAMSHGFTLAAAGLAPLGRDGDTQGEVTASWEGSFVGMATGYALQEQEPRQWAEIRVTPFGWLSMAYAADLRRDGSVASETSALKLGTDRYLILARKAEEGGEGHYCLGWGAKF